MPISWDRYIAAAARALKPLLPVNEQIPLKTRSIGSGPRLTAAKALETLDWWPKFTFFSSKDGFFARLYDLKTQKHYSVVCYYSSSNLHLSRVQNFLKTNNLSQVQFDDAFFFYCVDAVEIPLRTDLVTTDLCNHLSFSINEEEALIDYQKMRTCFGDFFVWETDHITGIDEQAPLLLLQQDATNLYLTYNPTASLIGFSKNESPRYHFNFNEVAKRLLVPVAEAGDVELQSARISMEAHENLVDLWKIDLCRHDIVFNAKGGLFFEFNDASDVTNFGISLRGMPQEQVDLVAKHLYDLGATPFDLGDGLFLAFAYHLVGFLENPGSDVNADAFADSIGLEPVFNADISAIRDTFERILVVSAPTQIADTFWWVLLDIAIHFKKMRSPFITPSILSSAKRLHISGKVRRENIYLSLTASHWKHSFLEIYRVIEGLYYFGWMHRLKVSIGSASTEHDLSIQCKSDLMWSFKEIDSIQLLFSLVPVTAMETCQVMEINCIRERFKASMDWSLIMKGLANAIYSIRNTGVHQGNHATDLPIKVTADCWPKLTHALFLIVEYFYTAHESGMPPSERAVVIESLQLQN